MLRGNFITIAGFGNFGMTTKERKKRMDREEASAKRRYIRRKLKELEIKKRERRRPRLEKINNSRAAIGMKPLTLDEFIHISKKRKPRKLKTYTKFNYTFEILDTLNQSQ